MVPGLEFRDEELRDGFSSMCARRSIIRIVLIRSASSGPPECPMACDVPLFPHLLFLLLLLCFFVSLFTPPCPVLGPSN